MKYPAFMVLIVSLFSFTASAMERRNIERLIQLSRARRKPQSLVLSAELRLDIILRNTVVGTEVQRDERLIRAEREINQYSVDRGQPSFIEDEEHYSFYQKKTKYFKDLYRIAKEKRDDQLIEKLIALKLVNPLDVWISTTSFRNLIEDLKDWIVVSNNNN